MSEKDKYQFPSGATSSKVPRWELLPIRPLLDLIKRHELGLERHKDGAYNNLTNAHKPIEDKEWVISRCGHVINHAMMALNIILGNLEDDGDDHGTAIMFGGEVISEHLRLKREGRPEEPPSMKLDPLTTYLETNTTTPSTSAASAVKIMCIQCGRQIEFDGIYRCSLCPNGLYCSRCINIHSHRKG